MTEFVQASCQNSFIVFDQIWHGDILYVGPTFRILFILENRKTYLKITEKLE